MAALNAGVPFSREFDTENLRAFRTLEVGLGRAIMDIHSLVHNTLDGEIFISFRSSVAPIFWPSHAFLDEIRSEWKQALVPGNLYVKAGYSAPPHGL
jgi:hypothetical protein